MSKEDKDHKPDPEQPSEGFLHRRRHRWWDLRASFLTGLVVAAPIGITAYLAIALINFADRVVEPMLPAQYSPDAYLPFTIPGLGLIIVILAITLLGALTANFFGNALLGFMGRIIDRVPVVRTIYGAIRQIFETVVSQSERSFQQVGLIEYPRPGLWAVCFIAAETTGEIIHHTNQEMVSVFLPTTPNPTSGFLLFVPHKEITILDMTVEEGAKLVISGGLVVPDFNDGDASVEEALTKLKNATPKKKSRFKSKSTKHDDAA